MSGVTVTDLASLPPTLTVQQTAEILALSTDAVYDGIRRGEVPSIRVGRRIVVPTLKLVAMLGLEADEPAASPSSPALRRIS